MKLTEKELFLLETINRQTGPDRVVFKIDDVENLLGISREEIIEAISVGKLRCKKIAANPIQWRISTSAFLDYYRKHILKAGE